MTSPFAALGLPDTASEAEVRAAFRVLVRSAHPDAGGDPSVFMRLRDDYHNAIQAAATRPCPTCKGSKYITETRGWVSVKLLCPDCGFRR